MGHIISIEGIKPNPEKVKAIMNAPRPNDVQQLKSYLGLINYYGKFLPNLSTLLHPLYQLTKKDIKFEWSSECETAFQSSKLLLLNNQLLVHYDANKEIVLFCDASPYGLGAILSHIFDNEDKPIFFASCTLTDTQKKYPQLHRKALAIIFGVKKFHKYIAGRKFTLVSDHQPLREIFNESKAIPVANDRLQKWAIYLSAYDYTIQYRKGSKLAHADALSRLPLNEENEIVHININTITEISPVDMKAISKATSKDETLNEVCSLVINFWPDAVEGVLKHYFHKRLMLGFEDGCLFFGNRIVIPSDLQQKVLEKLHATHVGISRMKLLAKEYVWWLTIESDIENYAKACTACQIHQATPSKVALKSWDTSSHFFERVHIDFFSYENTQFFILIDTYLRWIDVKIMTNTKCARVIEVLRTVFAYFGLPKTVVADNGPPFNSAEFRGFLSNNGVKYLNSPPYHPESNGWAENGVRTVKNSLKKMTSDTKTKNVPMQLKLDNFLMQYRNTPVTTTKKSPNNLVFIFRTRTAFANMNDKQTKDEIQGSTKTKADKQTTIKEKDHISFEKNEQILCRNVGNTKVKWSRGVILERLSRSIYKIKLHSGHIRTCHGEQLRKFIENEFIASKIVLKSKEKNTQKKM